MIIISTILFFINIIFKCFLKLFLWNSFITKIILLCIMSYILWCCYNYPKKQRLRLSSLRKIRLEFPYAYIFKDNFDEIRSLLICLLYYSIFIFGILTMRVYGVNRMVDLKVYYNLLILVLKNMTYVDMGLNISLIVIGVLLYRQVMKYIFKWFKFHRIKVHLYMVKFDNSYTYIIDKSAKYHIALYYARLVDNIRHFLYYLGLKKLNKKSNNLRWDIERRENASAVELFFLGYLLSQNYRIHYHILFLIFVIELFYNDFILAYIYTVLPLVFIYEIWVRLSKAIDVKNITYDIALYNIIHVSITYIDDQVLVFETNVSKRIYEKTYLKEIIKKYVRNDFKDKDMENIYKNIQKGYNLLGDLKNSMYFVYFCIFILIHHIL